MPEIGDVIRDIQENYQDKYFVDGFMNAMPDVEQGDTYVTHLATGRERALSVKKSNRLNQAKTIKQRLKEVDQRLKDRKVYTLQVNRTSKSK